MAKSVIALAEGLKTTTDFLINKKNPLMTMRLVK